MGYMCLAFFFGFDFHHCTRSSCGQSYRRTNLDDDETVQTSVYIPTQRCEAIKRAHLMSHPFHWLHLSGIEYPVALQQGIQASKREHSMHVMSTIYRRICFIVLFICL
jgi:hypothetical protein